MPVSRYDVALLTGSAVVAVLVAAVVFAGSSRRWSWEGLGLGVLSWWLAAAAATSLWMPGASYAFVWPLLAILIGQAVAFLVPRGRPVALVASWLGAVPLLVLQLTIIDGDLQRAEHPAGPVLDDPGGARRRGAGAGGGAGWTVATAGPAPGAVSDGWRASDGAGSCVGPKGGGPLRRAMTPREEASSPTRGHPDVNRSGPGSSRPGRCRGR